MPLKVIQGLCPDKSGKDENEKAVVIYIFPFFLKPFEPQIREQMSGPEIS